MNGAVVLYVKGVRWLKRRAVLEIFLYNGLLVVAPSRMLEELIHLPVDLNHLKVRLPIESVEDVYVMEDGMTIGLTINVSVEESMSPYLSSHVTSHTKVQREISRYSVKPSERTNERATLLRWRLKDGKQHSTLSLDFTISTPNLILSPAIRDAVIRNWASTIGSKKTPAKAESSRKNGQKGGRPTILRGESQSSDL